MRSGRLTAWCRRHDLRIFFGLAFLLSWLPWPLVLLNPESSPLVPFGPLIAGVATAWLTGGRGRLRRLVVQLGRWRTAPRWYVIAVVAPLAITGLAAGLTAASGANLAPRFAVDLTQLAITLVSTLLLVGLFEEVGWRGYALPRLQQRMPTSAAALLLGVVWAFWHLPELVSDPTGQRPLVQFLVMALAQSVFLSWLYNRTGGSLPVVMITHTAVDTVARFVLPLFNGVGYQHVWWYLAGLWVAAAVGVWINEGQRRSSSHQRTHITTE